MIDNFKNNKDIYDFLININGDRALLDEAVMKFHQDRELVGSVLFLSKLTSFSKTTCAKGLYYIIYNNEDILKKSINMEKLLNHHSIIERQDAPFFKKCSIRIMTDMLYIMNIDIKKKITDKRINIKRKYYYDKLRIKKGTKVEQQKDLWINGDKLKDMARSRIDNKSGMLYNRSDMERVSEQVIPTKSGFSLEVVVDIDIGLEATLNRRIRYLYDVKNTLVHNKEKNTFKITFLDEDFEYKINFSSKVLEELLGKEYLCIFTYMAFNIEELERC